MATLLFFAALAGANICPASAILITSLFFFQVSIYEHLGLTRGLAASMFGVSVNAMTVAMPAVGRPLELTHPKHLFSATLALSGATLAGITFVENTATAMIHGTISGIIPKPT